MRLTSENKTPSANFSRNKNSNQGSFFNKEKENPFFNYGHSVQTKLKIGKPGDKYEKEADSMADKVVNKTESSGIQKMGEDKEEEIQQKPLASSITPLVQKMENKEEEKVQAKCAECEKEKTVQKMDEKEEPEMQAKQEEEEEPIQAKGNSSTTNNKSIESNLNSSKGGGNPMKNAVRTEMEHGFGLNLSGVRVHTDSQAVQMNKEIGAQAFTHGNDIYFNQGKYNPGSKEGKHLLAHELTHTVQQGKGANKNLQMMSAAGALTIAQNLNRTYPNWLNVLPNCPCTYNSAMADSSTWNDATTPLTSSYHPGADKDVRTKNGYSTIADSSHGQQCTYDVDGKLITSGPGAGTPDVWTPNSMTNFVNHRIVDVNTYNALGSNIYVRYWQPNNGNSCEANNGGGRNVPLTTSAEAKIVAIRDLLFGWTSDGDVDNIVRILGTITTAVEMAVVRSDIRPLLVSYLSDIGHRTRIRLALVRL